MPTPPFSPDRQAWLQEISGLFKRKDKGRNSEKTVIVGKEREGSVKSIQTTSSESSYDSLAKENKAMGNGPRWAR